MKYWLITGRLCGDDEDTAHTYHAETAWEATKAFREELSEEAGLTLVELELATANGEGIFINCVASSDTAISL